MKAKILVYHDSVISEVVVLQVKCDDANLIKDYGRSFEDWPSDLDVYSLTNGLWVWEGDVDPDDSAVWEGVWRGLTDNETAHLTEGNQCLT